MGEIQGQREGQGDSHSKGYIEGKIDSREGIWWRIKLRPDSSFFPGWVGLALRKLGIITKQKQYTYEDSIDVSTTVNENGDPVTTIRPKD